MDDKKLKSLSDEAKRHNIGNDGMIRDGALSQAVEADERKKAARLVESDIAAVFQDLAQTRKPGQSAFLQVLSCDSLRISLDNLNVSAEGKRIDAALREKAEQTEVDATTGTTPFCKNQLKTYRNPQNNLQEKKFKIET